MLLICAAHHFIHRAKRRRTKGEDDRLFLSHRGRRSWIIYPSVEQRSLFDFSHKRTKIVVFAHRRPTRHPLPPKNDERRFYS